MTNEQNNDTDAKTISPSGAVAIRRPSLVEITAIQILSQPIYLNDLRDGLARGTVRSAPTPINAWPLLLSRDQLTQYLQASWWTLSHACPVAPIDLGVNLIRYSRPQIDDWIATLPARDQTTGVKPPAISTIGEPLEDAVADPRLAALEMARARPGRQG